MTILLKNIANLLNITSNYLICGSSVYFIYSIYRYKKYSNEQNKRTKQILFKNNDILDKGEIKALNKRSKNHSNEYFQQNLLKNLNEIKEKNLALLKKII